MIGCIVFGSPVAPATTRPPATGVSVAEALAPGPPEVGGAPPAQAVATSMAAPKIAISRLMSLSPRSLRSPMDRTTCLNYVPEHGPVRLAGSLSGQTTGASPTVALCEDLLRGCCRGSAQRSLSWPP